MALNSVGAIVYTVHYKVLVVSIVTPFKIKFIHACAIPSSQVQPQACRYRPLLSIFRATCFTFAVRQLDALC